LALSTERKASPQWHKELSGVNEEDGT
jgi:hypothetical protein